MKKYLIIVVEYLASLLFRIEKRDGEDISDLKFGFVELNGVGDIVACNAVINYFESTNKDVTLILPTFAKKLYEKRFDIITCDVSWSREKNKYNIKDIISTILDLRKKIKNSKIDIFLDTRGDIRKVLLLKLAGAKKVISYDKMISGVENYMNGSLLYEMVEYPNLNLHRSEEHKYFISKVFKDNDVLNYLNTYTFAVKDMLYLEKIYSEKIVLHLSGGVGNKVWNIDKWESVITFLNKEYNCNTFFVICTSIELDYIEKFIRNIKNTSIIINVIIKDLYELHYFLNDTRLYIGIDSGPLHIADSLGIRVIGLYGKSILKTWHPINNGINSICHVQKECKECSPKFKVQNTENINCIEKINIDKVINKIDIIMKGND